MTSPALNALAIAIRTSVSGGGGGGPPTNYNQYFTFDNVDSTTIFDEVGSLDVDITGTATYQAGVDSNGLVKNNHVPSFHGASFTNPFLKEYSVSFWIIQVGTLNANNVSDFGVITTIASNFSSKGIIIDCFAPNGTLRFLVGNAGGFTTCPYGASSAADIRDATRHHCVLTIQFNDPSSEMFAYFDGVARASPTALTNFVDWHGAVLNIFNRDTTTWSLSGLLIDELKIYNRVLSQTEVTALFDEFAIP